MRIPNWLIGIVFLAAVALVALLWYSDAPLGVAGEWTWPRMPVDAAAWATIVPGAVLVGLYTLLVRTGARRMQCAGAAEAAGWLAALFVAGCAWIWIVIETTPGPFGLGRGPFVVFYPRTSGYFLQAREGLDHWPEFLAGYESELEQGDNLHLGTHPPGLAMGFGSLLKLCRENPAMANFVLATRPESVLEATEALGATESSLLPGYGRPDTASLWLASLLTMLCAVATIWPLYGLLIRAVDRSAAWSLVALWPLVPSVAIFYPKSDLLYPLFAMMFAWLWMTGWERGIVWRCAVAAIVLLASLLMSLAFLPSAAIVGLASLIQWRSDWSSDDWRLQKRRVWCGIATVTICAVGILMFWLAYDVNLLNVWRLNLVNHASFYDEYQRTWWMWLLVNPLELAVAAGPVVAVLALFGAGRNLKEGLRSPVSLSVVIVWGGLWLSGKNMGEAARLWIFLMPWLLVVAACGLRTVGDVPAKSPGKGTAHADCGWLFLIALQAVLCLLTAHSVDGFHFEELLDGAEETRQPTLDDGRMPLTAQPCMPQRFPTTPDCQPDDGARVRA